MPFFDLKTKFKDPLRYNNLRWSQPLHFGKTALDYHGIGQKTNFKCVSQPFSNLITTSQYTINANQYVKQPVQSQPISSNILLQCQ